ncbi:MAG: MutS family DNA mismatch repair protein [Candidatus Promineifilaceae bacterium]
MMKLGKTLGREELLARQIGKLERRLEKLQQRSGRLAQLRLAVFFTAVFSSAFAFLQWGAWPWLVTLGVGLVPFAGLVWWHRRVETAVHHFDIWLDIRRTNLARLRLEWDALPPPLPVPARFDHPFALDLDMVGERSVHRLLDTAVSEEGSERLRGWLLVQTPNLPEIARRQKVVAELVRWPLFRDKLILKARLVAQTTESRWPGRQLLQWLAAHAPNPRLRPLAVGLSGLALLFWLLFGLAQQDTLPSVWRWVWLVYVVVYGSQWAQAGDLFHDVVFIDDSLRRLSPLFQFLEQHNYGRFPHLQALCQPILQPDEKPSTYIRRLQRVVTAVGIRQNPFLALLINLLFPWDMVVALLLQKERERLAALLPSWLDVWFELEALSSLATYAYLHPETTVPVIDDSEDIVFTAVRLGHPLLPEEMKVRNDFAMSQMGEIAMITGSNMSGKSTFLRTVGVNLAMAFAGGMVDAASLVTRPFRLFSSIRVSDSVTDGYSFFYAEVRRLAQLLTSLADKTAVPLFYFIDEIFRGTNNRERLIGSRAYVRALANKKGVGLVATHDLELVKLADEITAVHNYHFRDDVADGKMVFDYTLRSGPCPTTNALKIMALAGLPVPERTEE